MEEKIERAKYFNGDLTHFDYINDEDMLRITSFCSNTNMAIKILRKVMNLVPEIRGPRADEE